MNNRLPIYFILFTLVIDAMGIGLIMPVMPDLIRDVRGADLADAAIWGGILAAAFAVMQILFSPLLGNLSDRFGRRPVLLISMFFLAIDSLLMAFASSIWLLLIGRIIGGITAATQSTATAYVADISDPAQKAANFGLVSAAFGFGFIFGPILGGSLSEFGPRAPFIVAAGLAGVNFLFGFFVLRETVTDEIRRPFEWKRANPFGALKSMGRAPGLTGLMIVLFFYQIAFYVYPAVWAYFTKEKFGWDGPMVGYSLTVFGIGIVFVQGFLLQRLIKRWGEDKTLIAGMVFSCVAMVAIAIVPWGWALMALTPLTTLGVISSPAIMAIMSRTMGDDQQGELQGIVTPVSATGMLVSTILMTQVFALAIKDDGPVYLPTAPFWVAMALMIVSLFIFLIVRKRVKRLA